jgi:carbamoyltransferase
LVTIYDDGSLWLNQDYFNYATGLTMTQNRKWEALFGFAKRQPEDELESHHCDLALAIQQVTEDIVLKMAATAQRVNGQPQHLPCWWCSAKLRSQWKIGRIGIV